VHRDLKGGNVLMTMDGTVKLADFGASKHFRDPNKTDMMKSLKGSAFWMAPEVLESKYGKPTGRILWQDTASQLALQPLVLGCPLIIQGGIGLLMNGGGNGDLPEAWSSCVECAAGRFTCAAGRCCQPLLFPLPTPAGRKADIWSLGCTVLEMLTAKHPWPDIDNQWSALLAINQAQTGPPRPAGLSAEANDFLDQCFQVRWCDGGGGTWWGGKGEREGGLPAV
jgi:serine/threonine protein kinase